MNFFAQAADPRYNFWAKEPGWSAIIAIIAASIIGIAVMIGMMFLPTRARRPVVWGFTFFCGSFYILYYLWPKPIDRKTGEIADGFVDAGGFLLQDTLPRFADIANLLTFILLCLGIYSLGRIHIGKIFKRQKDWPFSVVLIVSMFVMTGVGYVDYYIRSYMDPDAKLMKPENWSAINYANDLLFDGLIQQMDAAMFSIIAFYILSAAFRAFRVRSIEATVMMASAVILMFSIMGAVDFLWSGMIDNATNTNGAHFLNNFRLDVISQWIKSNLQVPSLRALDFGVGLGALAMGLRIWLGLEKGGVSV